jgi:hypothetical protein
MKKGIGCGALFAMALGLLVGGAYRLRQSGGGGGLVSTVGASIATNLMRACDREASSVDACYPVSAVFDACWRSVEAQP